MQKTNIHINCKDCGIHKLCLPAMLAEAEVAHLDSIVKRSSKPIKKGSSLFTSGDPFTHMYAIRSGAFKSYVNSYSGEQQIIAFHLPGELIGFDGINSGIHNSTAVALMDSHICKVPFELIDELSGEIKGLRTQIMRLMSKEITEDQEMLLLLGQKQSKERMAALLVNLSTRFKARNLPHELFMLPMSRRELANYLGLTIETVSRVFKEFKINNWIEIVGKKIHIKNMTKIKQLAGIYCH